MSVSTDQPLRFHRIEQGADMGASLSQITAADLNHPAGIELLPTQPINIAAVIAAQSAASE